MSCRWVQYDYSLQSNVANNKIGLFYQQSMPPFMKNYFYSTIKDWNEIPPPPPRPLPTSTCYVKDFVLNAHISCYYFPFSTLFFIGCIISIMLPFRLS